jgi:polyisoprenoid-binding protein YceI
MRRHATNTLRALLFLAPTMIAWTPANPILTMQPQSRLWVSGTSTVRSFECKTSAFTAEVEATGPGAIAAVLAGEKGVAAVSVEVPAAKLDCSNGTMNEHMLKALKAKEHPTIAFKLTSYTTTRTATGVQGEITGVLSLGGVEKTITFPGTAKDGGNGMLNVVGTHEISMKEYGLKPPSLMLGTMKVGDRVKVGFDLTLKG